MTNDNQDDLWGTPAADDTAQSESGSELDMFGMPVQSGEDGVAEPLANDAASAGAVNSTTDFAVATPAFQAKAQSDGYVVLARKYRPQTFDDLVGQAGVQQALRGAIATGQISHAYLFSGPRGTGKTSTARILAKAVNCQNGGPRPDPCGKCSSCRSITAGSSLDVIEIDAASNTGVDNIRELKSGVVLAPFSRYKVYIVDEVHMLSNQAFNALLKTLEEPPPQVIFVLATTELHKVPETIISRCQTFLFRRFSLAELNNQLGNILDIECGARGITVDPEDRERILDLIARNAEGGMRDAQVTLDQVLVLSKGKLDFDSVRRFLGMADKEALDGFIKHLHERDARGLLELVDELVSQGQDLELFVKSACEFMRNLLLVKTTGRDTPLINVSEDRALELEAMVAPISTGFLIGSIENFIHVVGEMKASGQPRIVLELAALKLTLKPDDASLEGILRRLDALESRTPGSAPPAQSGGRQRRPDASEAKTGTASSRDTQTPSASAPSRPVAPASSVQSHPDHRSQAVNDSSHASDSGPQHNAIPVASINESVPVGDAAQMASALAQRLQVESNLLFMSYEKIYCGQEFDGRNLSLFIASAPRMAASQVLRPQNVKIITDLGKTLFGDEVAVKLVNRDDLQPIGPQSAGEHPAQPARKAAAPAQPQSSRGGESSTARHSARQSGDFEDAAPSAAAPVSKMSDDGLPTIYYPAEIREKAMVEIKSEEFERILQTDEKLNNFIDHLKSVFGIDKRHVKFLRSTLA